MILDRLQLTGLLVLVHHRLANDRGGSLVAAPSRDPLPRLRRPHLYVCDAADCSAHPLDCHAGSHLIVAPELPGSIQVNGVLEIRVK